jgi:hypothetical protein
MLSGDCPKRPGKPHCSRHRCAKHPKYLVCCGCGEHDDEYVEGYHELSHAADGVACGAVGPKRTARQMLVDAARRTRPL